MPDTITEFDYEAHLLACAAGERDALRRLYDHESARLLGVAMRIVRDRARAEDIVHDAFLRIWSQAVSFDPRRGSARGWMYVVTRHLALDAVRGSSRETVLDAEVAVAADTEAALIHWQDAIDAFDWRASGERLQRCLERLDPVRRNCILHAYVDGLSHADIAGRIDAPLGTVKAWIRRSLGALRECLA